MHQLPDIEEYLRQNALAMFLNPPQAKSQNHLGYMTFVYKDGSAHFGELCTDEPHESREQYEAWAVETAASIPEPETLAAIGFSYNVYQIIHLFRITPQYVVGETCSVTLNGEVGDWRLNPLKDPFVMALWALISA